MKGRHAVLLYIVYLVGMNTSEATELTSDEQACKCNAMESSTKFYTITTTLPANTTVKSPTTAPTSGPGKSKVSRSTTRAVDAPTTADDSSASPTANAGTTQAANGTTMSTVGASTTQAVIASATPVANTPTTQSGNASAAPATGEPTARADNAPTTTDNSSASQSANAPTTPAVNGPTMSATGAPTTQAVVASITQTDIAMKTSTANASATPAATVSPNGPSIKTMTAETSRFRANTKPNCSDVCSNYQSKQESKYPATKPIWDLSNLSIPLSIYVEGIFSQTTLSNKSSSQYIRVSEEFRTALCKTYENVTSFKDVGITGFSAGSIKCDFVVKMTSDKSVDPYSQYKELRGVSFENFQVKIGNKTSKIELNKTESAINMTTAAYFSKACTCSTYTACQDNGSKFICSHKCDVNNICSKFGDCYVDKKGTVKCRCREDSYYVYKGDTCEEKVLVFFNGKNTAIVGACAGVVVAFLLLLFIYIGARWRHKRTRKGTDEKLSDPREIQRDNYNIENVPLDGVGKTNPAYRPDQNDRHGHDDHYPADQPTTENVYEEELAYDEGRYYRVLNDPESRSKAFVYQPTNMSIPDHRTSTASKFDDLDSKPPSFYMRPEIEQRRYHEFMDTEHPYSIKRPQIMRSNVNSDGYR